MARKSSAKRSWGRLNQAHNHHRQPDQYKDWTDVQLVSLSEVLDLSVVIQPPAGFVPKVFSPYFFFVLRKTCTLDRQTVFSSKAFHLSVVIQPFAKFFPNVFSQVHLFLVLLRPEDFGQTAFLSRVFDLTVVIQPSTVSPRDFHVRQSFFLFSFFFFCHSVRPTLNTCNTDDEKQH